MRLGRRLASGIRELRMWRTPLPVPSMTETADRSGDKSGTPRCAPAMRHTNPPPPAIATLSYFGTTSRSGRRSPAVRNSENVRLT